MAKSDYPCPEPKQPCQWTRDDFRDIATNTVWVVLGKYSAVLLLVGSLITYIYNQSNSYTDAKLNTLIRKSEEQDIVNQK